MTIVTWSKKKNSQGLTVRFKLHLPVNQKSYQNTLLHNYPLSLKSCPPLAQIDAHIRYGTPVVVILSTTQALGTSMPEKGKEKNQYENKEQPKKAELQNIMSPSRNTYNCCIYKR